MKIIKDAPATRNGAERAVNKLCNAVEESNIGTLDKEMIVQALRNYWLCIKPRNI